MGGVDAAKRVQAGEPFDVVVLASDAIDTLIAAGRVVTGSRVDLVRSPVAIAVRAGAPQPDVASPEALRRAVLAARSVGYSTGPERRCTGASCSSAGASPQKSGAASCRRRPACRWARWWRAARSSWASSNSAS